MTMFCQRCKSDRVGDMQAKCSDLSGGSIGVGDDAVEWDGYMPDDLGIGGGDYVTLEWCLDCGQLQGEWPLPVSKLEAGE